MVSILGDYTYEFPQEFPLKKRLKDLLEKEVDEKFYISNERVESIVNGDVSKTIRAGGRGSVDRHSWDLVKDPKCVEVEPIRVGGLYDDEKSKHQAGAIWDKEAIAPTVDTMQGGNRQPLITEEPKVKRLGNIYNEKFTGCSFGGNVWDKNGLAPTLKTTAAASQQFVMVEPLAYDEQNGYIRKDGTVGTLTTGGSSPKHNNRVIENCYVSEKGVRFICSPKRGMATDVNADICQPLTAKGQANWTGSFVSPDIESLEKSSTIGGAEPTKINLKNGETLTSNDNLSHLRIRKLTPKECWRLMGFTDEDFEKAAQYNSNSQLYKQAGNSIVVSVLYYIFKGMM
jgi:DNA (cytosine-5)-methyltransferase 1